jgi:hypothetical protein
MPNRVYVPERNIEYWTSQQIHRFFENAGFVCSEYPLSQVVEKKIPLDFIFEIEPPRKIFGLQYEVLYEGRRAAYWRLSGHQHKRIGGVPWISYALSELRERRHRQNALHTLRLRRANFPFVRSLFLENRGKDHQMVELLREGDFMLVGIASINDCGI